MAFPRSSGILCHPTSFPSRHGVGDLGKGAYDFVDWLAAAKQQLWQVLPLGPTGYGDSPYQCFSAFAGNPLLISPDGLVHSRLLPADALEAVSVFPTHQVDFGPVIAHKQALLRRSFEYFKTHATADQRVWFEAFRAAKRELAGRLRALHGVEGLLRRRKLARLAAGYPRARAGRVGPLPRPGRRVGDLS